MLQGDARFLAGGCFEHQGIKGRSDWDSLVAGRESPHRADPIDAGT
jgi:hypothetical protein